MMASELLSGTLDGTYRGAAIDSRRLAGGEIFFAFPGEQTDGHRFVAAALEGGARAAVVEKAYADSHPEALGAWKAQGTVLGVEAGLEALHALTRGVRRQVPERLVAITGSAGKTTTKEILAELLGRRFRVAKTPGNLNNFLGFPLALLGVPDDTEWMVAELGMSEAGELAHLSRLARPEAVVLTNVGPAHLEFFGSLEAIAEAKAEILEGLAGDGLVVANGGDPLVRRVIERFGESFGGRTVFYGLGTEAEAPGCEVRAENVTATAAGGSRFELVAGGEGKTAERHTVELPLHGLYNVENFLAAATCAGALGVRLEEVSQAAADLSVAGGRGSVHRRAGEITVVDDSYNSNPRALYRALESAAALPGRRHWAVVGDMLELGPTAPELHRQAGRDALELGFGPVVGVGALAAELVDEVRARGGEGRWFADAPAAAAWAREHLQAGDTVLIKGSRGVGLEAVVAAVLAEPAGGEP